MKLSASAVETFRFRCDSSVTITLTRDDLHAILSGNAKAIRADGNEMVASSGSAHAREMLITHEIRNNQPIRDDNE